MFRLFQILQGNRVLTTGLTWRYIQESATLVFRAMINFFHITSLLYHYRSLRPTPVQPL